MIYRREIDGLRTLAVVPVIMFHAGLTIFSGGFVGVDVFFVISGYLITSILIDELEKGKFSIARFYERRARRILPALTLVMLCCLPFAWLWMPASEMKDFAQSIIAVVFFASNILFWREEGYFAPAAELKPLLHTWSLAVEEQYYLLFPVFLLIGWRFGRNRVFWSVFVIAAISLAASEWGWRHRPSANFYLAPTRAWELLVGSMCAFRLYGREPLAQNWWSLLGLGMIVFSIFHYDNATPFPSLYALTPVLGAALIILFGGPGSWVARLLSTRPFVGIGLISYSAYLWHQPLFAFARIRSIGEPAQSLMLALGALSLGLAYLSWRYVERPFRKGQDSVLATRRAVFAASAAVGLIFLAIGAVGHLGHGFDSRFPKDKLAYLASENNVSSKSCNFDFDEDGESKPRKECVRSQDGKVDTMLIGDSHMWALTDGLRDEMIGQKQSFYITSHTRCLPFWGLKLSDGSKEYDCQRFVERSFKWARENGVKTVVIAARFPLYLQGARYDNGEGGKEDGDCAFVDLQESARTKCDDPERQKRMLGVYEARIRELAKSYNVVLVDPIPEAGWNVPETAFKLARFKGIPVRLNTSYIRYKERAREVLELFERLASELPNVRTVRVEKMLCDEADQRCKNVDEKGVYYYDDDHLSNTGARLVAPMIVEAVKSVNAGRR